MVVEAKGVSVYRGPGIQVSIPPLSSTRPASLPAPKRVVPPTTTTPPPTRTTSPPRPNPPTTTRTPSPPPDFYIGDENGTEHFRLDDDDDDVLPSQGDEKADEFRKACEYLSCGENQNLGDCLENKYKFLDHEKNKDIDPTLGGLTEALLEKECPKNVAQSLDFRKLLRYLDYKHATTLMKICRACDKTVQDCANFKNLKGEVDDPEDLSNPKNYGNITCKSLRDPDSPFFNWTKPISHQLMATEEENKAALDVKKLGEEKSVVERECDKAKCSDRLLMDCPLYKFTNRDAPGVIAARFRNDSNLAHYYRLGKHKCPPKEYGAPQKYTDNPYFRSEITAQLLDACQKRGCRGLLKDCIEKDRAKIKHTPSVIQTAGNWYCPDPKGAWDSVVNAVTGGTMTKARATQLLSLGLFAAAVGAMPLCAMQVGSCQKEAIVKKYDHEISLIKRQIEAREARNNYLAKRKEQNFANVYNMQEHFQKRERSLWEEDKKMQNPDDAASRERAKYWYDITQEYPKITQTVAGVVPQVIENIHKEKRHQDEKFYKAERRKEHSRRQKNRLSQMARRSRKDLLDRALNLDQSHLENEANRVVAQKDLEGLQEGRANAQETGVMGHFFRKLGLSK